MLLRHFSVYWPFDGQKELLSNLTSFSCLLFFLLFQWPFLWLDVSDIIFGIIRLIFTLANRFVELSAKKRENKIVNNNSKWINKHVSKSSILAVYHLQVLKMRKKWIQIEMHFIYSDKQPFHVWSFSCKWWPPNWFKFMLRDGLEARTLFDHGIGAIKMRQAKTIETAQWGWLWMHNKVWKLSYLFAFQERDKLKLLVYCCEWSTQTKQ